jgi:hypothetical protein
MRQPWQIGGLLGLVTGVAVFLVGALVTLLVHSGAFSAIALLVWVVVLIAAGIIGARATGRFLGGVLTGLWCGIVIALCSSVLGLAQDLVFASLLVHGAWAHDATCPYTVSRVVAACETSDDLGWFATVLTALPVLGAFLGGLAGLVSGDSRSRSSSAPLAITRTAVLIPLAFLILQAFLFIGELIWNFW